MDYTILRERRKKKGVNLHNMAKTMGISAGHLSYIERGYRKPSLELLERMCKELDMELGFMLK